MFVLLAMSWRFLRPYFLIAMMILTFWWSKKETKRLIFSKSSSGAIWLKYGPKKIGGVETFQGFVYIGIVFGVGRPGSPASANKHHLGQAWANPLHFVSLNGA